MNPGSTQTVTLYCTPSTSELIETDIEVQFLPITLGKVYIAVKGQGENVDVILSTSVLNMDPSFISLSVHRTLKIKNLSSQPVMYTWKSYVTMAEEEEERDRLLYEINRMESIEKNILLENVPQEGYENTLVNSSDEEYGMELNNKVEKDDYNKLHFIIYYLLFSIYCRSIELFELRFLCCTI